MNVTGAPDRPSFLDPKLTEIEFACFPYDGIKFKGAFPLYFLWSYFIGLELFQVKELQSAQILGKNERSRPEPSVPLVKYRLEKFDRYPQAAILPIAVVEDTAAHYTYP